jgi:hypothetical protein
MDQEEEVEKQLDEENSLTSLDEPAAREPAFYRMDDRFARWLNECDPVLLPKLRRKRQDTPIVIHEQDEDDHGDDEFLMNGGGEQLLLMQSLPVETNAMLKASLYTSCTNRCIVIPGAKKLTPATTETIPFVVQHIGHYQHQPYTFSMPSE